MPITTKKEQYLLQPDATMYYFGIDKDTYPGNTFMYDMWVNTNIRFTGFYLGGTSTISGPCCHPTSSWMPASNPSSVRTYLAGLGYGFAPLYVGQQYDNPNCPSCNALTYDQGGADARNAAQLMIAAGFPDLSVCFLDVEAGGTLPASLISYISGWVYEMNNATGYWAGVYCSYESAGQISTAVGSSNVTLWVWDLNIQGCQENTPFPTPNPASAYPAAKTLQYAQGCTISNGVTTTSADLDSSLYSDPSRNPVQ